MSYLDDDSGEEAFSAFASKPKKAKAVDKSFEHDMVDVSLINRSIVVAFEYCRSGNFWHSALKNMFLPN